MPRCGLAVNPQSVVEEDRTTALQNCNAQNPLFPQSPAFFSDTMAQEREGSWQ